MLKMLVACLTAVSSLPAETHCFQPAPRTDLAFEVISQSPPPMTSGDTAYLYASVGGTCQSETNRKIACLVFGWCQ